MRDHSLNRLLTAASLALACYTPTHAAEAPVDADAVEVPTRTVYVVELIVFAHQAGLAGSEERWPPTVEPPPWDAAIVPMLPLLPEEEDDSLELMVDQAPEPVALDDANLELDLPAVPRPEVWVATPDQLMLGEPLARLQRDPRYEVLLHTAWRQEGIPRDGSFQVMVSDVPLGLYFPTAEELSLEIEAAEAASSSATNDDPASESAAAVGVVVVVDPNKAPTEADTVDGISPTEGLAASPYDDPTARLVGQVRVYLERYLHLQLDLVYDTDLIPDDSQLLVPPIVDTTTSVQAVDGPKDEPVVFERENDRRQTDPQRTEGQAGGFEVEKAGESQTLRIRLEESRRMRSTEVHYFDHPVIGVIATITPWEIPLTDEELETALDGNVNP